MRSFPFLARFSGREMKNAGSSGGGNSLWPAPNCGGSGAVKNGGSAITAWVSGGRSFSRLWPGDGFPLPPERPPGQHSLAIRLSGAECERRNPPRSGQILGLKKCSLPSVPEGRRKYAEHQDQPPTHGFAEGKRRICFRRFSPKIHRLHDDVRKPSACQNSGS